MFATAYERELAADVERHYRLLKQAQRRFGLARLELGVLLEIIRRKGLWQGKSATFTRFLEEEHINQNAAQQYMRVARRLYFEMQLTDAQFEVLCCVNMRTLEKAAAVITEDNKAEIVAIVSTLAERDALLSLAEYRDARPPDETTTRLHPRVERALSLYYDLPDELRSDFRRAQDENAARARAAEDAVGG